MVLTQCFVAVRMSSCASALMLVKSVTVCVRFEQGLSLADSAAEEAGVLGVLLTCADVF